MILSKIEDLSCANAECIFNYTSYTGSTGSGKTTQVPQYILDDYAKQRKYCNILVTQPRRIAAISIAKRVSQERGWHLGGLVGYQVALSKNTSEDTRLTYVTTGVLLRKLIQAKNLNQYTHIVLDEVRACPCHSLQNCIMYCMFTRGSAGLNQNPNLSLPFGKCGLQLYLPDRSYFELAQSTVIVQMSHARPSGKWLMQ